MFDDDLDLQDPALDALIMSLPPLVVEVIRHSCLDDEGKRAARLLLSASFDAARLVRKRGGE